MRKTCNVFIYIDAPKAIAGKPPTHPLTFTLLLPSHLISLSLSLTSTCLQTASSSSAAKTALSSLKAGKASCRQRTSSTSSPSAAKCLWAKVPRVYFQPSHLLRHLCCLRLLLLLLLPPRRRQMRKTDLRILLSLSRICRLIKARLLRSRFYLLACATERRHGQQALKTRIF